MGAPSLPLVSPALGGVVVSPLCVVPCVTTPGHMTLCRLCNHTLHPLVLLLLSEVHSPVLPPYLCVPVLWLDPGRTSCPHLVGRTVVCSYQVLCLSAGEPFRMGALDFPFLRWCCCAGPLRREQPPLPSSQRAQGYPIQLARRGGSSLPEGLPNLNSHCPVDRSGQMVVCFALTLTASSSLSCNVTRLLPRICHRYSNTDWPLCDTSSEQARNRTGHMPSWLLSDEAANI